MKKEIQSIRQILAAQNFFKWKVPIWHLIPSNYKCKVLGDVCLEGGRAFYEEFKFLYYVDGQMKLKTNNKTQ